MRASQRARNLEHITSARLLQTYLNANRGENTQPHEDVSVFLPHPMAWKLQNRDRNLDISQTTAKEILFSLSYFGPELEVILDAVLPEIQCIAQGL